MPRCWPANTAAAASLILLGRRRSGLIPRTSAGLRTPLPSRLRTWVYTIVVLTSLCQKFQVAALPSAPAKVPAKSRSGGQQLRGGLLALLSLPPEGRHRGLHRPGDSAPALGVCALSTPRCYDVKTVILLRPIRVRMKHPRKQSSQERTLRSGAPCRPHPGRSRENVQARTSPKGGWSCSGHAVVMQW